MIVEPASGVHTYVAPRTLAEVIDALTQHEDAKLIAGGQSLLVLLRQGLVTPSMLVSLRNVAELRRVAFSLADGCDIGAMTTQAVVAGHPDVQTHYAALADAASVVATRQVRTLGTLGGNLCHADPTADPPAALIALDAALDVAGPGGARRVAVAEFFRDYMEVDVAADEVLVGIHLPPPVSRAGSAYLKFRLREVDTALVGAAVWVRLAGDGGDGDGEIIQDARVGLAGAGPTPVRSFVAEESLRGQRATLESIARAAQAAAEACEPLSDTEASDWYRREMVGVFIQRAAQRALRRARSALQTGGATAA